MNKKQNTYSYKIISESNGVIKYSIFSSFSENNVIGYYHGNKKTLINGLEKTIQRLNNSLPTDGSPWIAKQKLGLAKIHKSKTRIVRNK